MEIKHGRAAMLGFLHIIAIEAGIRVPGYLSVSQDLKFSDVPAGCFASLEAVPTAGWLQIMVLTCMQEAGTGFASKPQTDDAEPGDIALDSWVRYDDPEVRTFKLNAERQNGRAAMLGVTGCLIHELLGVDALYPTGGLGGAAPPTIVAALAVGGQSDIVPRVETPATWRLWRKGSTPRSVSGTLSTSLKGSSGASRTKRLSASCATPRSSTAASRWLGSSVTASTRTASTFRGRCPATSCAFQESALRRFGRASRMKPNGRFS
jgi:hypothetical protein